MADAMIILWKKREIWIQANRWLKETLTGSGSWQPEVDLIEEKVDSAAEGGCENSTESGRYGNRKLAGIQPEVDKIATGIDW